MDVWHQSKSQFMTPVQVTIYDTSPSHKLVRILLNGPFGDSVNAASTDGIMSH
jgi:hypothetical protein